MKKIIALIAKRYPLIYDLFTVRLKFSLVALALVYAATAYGLQAAEIATSVDLFTRHGPIVGGDFLVFRAASLAAGGPNMLAIYDMANLSAMLREAYPGHGDMLFGWQYPPTMFLFVKPLSLFPYLASYGVWVAAFGGLFAWTVYRLWSDRAAVFFAVVSPAVFVAVITGQTGLLTASLIALSAAYADRKPLLAGIAAGLLTVKPQLGLLIPIAFAAAGCWRAFAAAAVTALLLAAASVAAFGIEPWLAFINAVAAHGERMTAASIFPLHKLVTPFGAMSLLGAPPLAALMTQVAATLALGVYVFIVWRRVAAMELRLAALATAALLATPYGFYYEMAVLVPAMMMIAKRAVETGWLKGERLSLIAVWASVLLTPGPDVVPGPPISFAIALFAFVIAARRALPAAGVRFASAGSPAPAGS